MTTTGPQITVLAPDGIPEIGPEDDLAEIVLEALGEGTLADGDIVVITSKVVSKAEGRIVTGDREGWIGRESARLVAQRGPTRIVRNRLGLTMAAAGIDASNVAAGTLVLLPLDPDASARRMREAFATRAAVNVGVIITDTAGRAWREGQTDIAIGAAGVMVVESFAGRVDAHGNELAVTAPAVADEIASAAELAQGKLGARPCALLRGRGDLVLPRGEHGTGAAALIRPDGADLFGYGAREAVLRAVAGRDADQLAFGASVSLPDLWAAFEHAGLTVRRVADDEADDGRGRSARLRCASEQRDSVRIVAFAHGWTIAADTDPELVGTDLRLLPLSP